MFTLQEQIDSLKAEIIHAKNAPAFAVAVKVKAAERCTEQAVFIIEKMAAKIERLENRLNAVKGA